MILFLIILIALATISMQFTFLKKHKKESRLNKAILDSVVKSLRETDGRLARKVMKIAMNDFYASNEAKEILANKGLNEETIRSLIGVKTEFNPLKNHVSLLTGISESGKTKLLSEFCEKLEDEVYLVFTKSIDVFNSENENIKIVNIENYELFETFVQKKQNQLLLLNTILELMQSELKKGKHFYLILDNFEILGVSNTISLIRQAKEFSEVCTLIISGFDDEILTEEGMLKFTNNFDKIYSTRQYSSVFDYNFRNLRTGEFLEFFTD